MTDKEVMQQEPVACRFCHSKKGCWTWQCYTCDEIDDVQQPALPLPVQEPMAWDKPSDNFNVWWDGDRRRDNANPFTTDSFSYWAFEGWQAALAQRPWVGLTEQERNDLENALGLFIGKPAFDAIEASLKQRNT